MIVPTRMYAAHDAGTIIQRLQVLVLSLAKAQKRQKRLGFALWRFGEKRGMPIWRSAVHA
jgi:hypothetical protein